MPSCVFKHCKNSSQNQKKEDGISFHRFPRDPVTRNDWVSIIRKSRQDDYWRPSKYCVVCSSHFKVEQFYYTEKGRRLVKKKSKPSQNLYGPPRSLQITEVPKNIKCEVEEGISSLSKTTKLPGSSNESQNVVRETAASYLLEFRPQPEKLTEINAVDHGIKASDLESRFDTPTKDMLRKELRKNQLFKLKTKRKLKTLQEEVRRLKNINCSLRNIIKDLKKENIVAT
ncbi:THAP domain-containing protein 1-like [Colias croceus]|uniref:THAP domain-containing protein 1-like n=1 Tax=Colias crocea TaxID=72248 RepID=UPI001E27D7E8|nr:THAP domain-containing protein 1-like [Colias croceus]